MRKTRLVLLPGLDGTEIFFRPLLAALPPWIEPVVVSYPTCGANNYGHLLEVVEEAVSSCRDFYVLGWSFSGPLALMLAASRPERIRGIILCASFVRPPLRLLPALRPATIGPMVHLMRVTHRLHLRMTRDCTDALRCDKFATLARVPSRVIAARGRAIMTLDARDLLHQCTRPVIYVAGSRDRVVPTRNAEEIVRELPTTRVVTIEGPHLALYTNPGAALEPLVGFIRAHDEAAPKS